MNNKLQLDDLTIDFSKQIVKRNDEVISLPKLSYQLLVYLVKNHQKTCSISSLIDGVWANTNVSDETVVQRIRLLRKTLNDDPKQPRYIESIRGFGYRLIPVPTECTEADSKKESSRPASINKFYLNKYLIITSLLGLAIVSFIYLNSLLTPSKPLSSTSNKVNVVKEKQPQRLIDRANYYRKIGQQDDLLRAVEIYQKLIQSDADNDQASVGLSLSLSGLVCRYNHPVKLAEEAQKIAENILIEKSSLAIAWETLAFSLDCQGNLIQALRYYRKAAQLNPNAYSAMSSAAHLLEKKGKLLQALKLNLKVKKNLNSPPITDLQIARNLELLGFDTRAEQIYRHLFEFHPDIVFINESYPQFLFTQQRFNESEKILQQVIKRQVKRRVIYQLYAELNWQTKNKQSAKTWFEKAVPINPNNSFPTTAYRIFNNEYTAEAATSHIKDLNKSILNGDIWPDTFMEIILLQHFVLKQQEQALETLSRLIQNGYMDKEYLQVSPWFNDFRKNQKFLALLEEINNKRETIKNEMLEAEWLPAQLLNEKLPWGELSI